jgi:ketosteroid isomerase-like protein
MKIAQLLGFFALFLLGCREQQTAKNQISVWEAEILETEQAFSQMSQEAGIPAAFLEYAADEAVLMRNNGLVKGKDAISQYFKSSPQPDSTAQLSWKPDFVSVAASGDLGYTYGEFVFSTRDSLGQVQTQKGVFHTVWKRQPDGRWRFVWD